MKLKGAISKFFSLGLLLCFVCRTKLSRASPPSTSTSTSASALHSPGSSVNEDLQSANTILIRSLSLSLSDILLANDHCFLRGHVRSWSSGERFVLLSAIFALKICSLAVAVYRSAPCTWTHSETSLTKSWRSTHTQVSSCYTGWNYTVRCSHSDF